MFKQKQSVVTSDCSAMISLQLMSFSVNSCLTSSIQSSRSTWRVIHILKKKQTCYIQQNHSILNSNCVQINIGITLILFSLIKPELPTTVSLQIPIKIMNSLKQYQGQRGSLKVIFSRIKLSGIKTRKSMSKKRVRYCFVHNFIFPICVFCILGVSIT